ncbi:hypothetical protein RJ639_010838 [Escallonia herrerae]|uniref:Cyclic nucleotide-binding domain-containing protein n=1 Tax=Escallonia herrerae TaxID=1293975 RepID=A0AA89ASS3_9ASTE|nr:hypothetical protein RJ639_010838 [Escallonia herrerae]
MLSLTANTFSNHPKTLLSSAFLTHHHRRVSPITHKSHQPKKPISSAINPPPNPAQQQLYQPFRPPPSPIPSKFRSLDTAGRLDILANRLGLWFEFAPLIPSLIQEGFTPSTLEEITGISGVEQNRLVVAAKVRDSLIESNAGSDILSFFDQGGAEVLYEIRLLSASQRLAAARYIVEFNLDGRGAQELARAVKDFPRRRGDRGWNCFDYTLPADCLSFVYYRQALEHQQNSEQRKLALEKAAGVAQSEAARNWVQEELKGKDGMGAEGEGGGVVEGVRVPVVRLNVGEVAEATVVAVLPVCKAEEKEKEVLDAPWECGSQGEFGVVVAEKGWRRWVVLPSWEPVAGLKRGGVVVEFADARALPWRVNRWYKEEAILVVADRGRKAVAADDGFYMVADGEKGLKVERGSLLKGIGVEESLGTVVLVVRPPREATDSQLNEEDWE